MRAGVMLVLGWLLVSPAQAIEMQLHGTLVAEPCSLEPDQQQLELNFGDIVAKSLYQNPRTPARPLVMRLSGCDTELGKDVELVFNGNADAEQPDLLALAGDAGAKGVAIGLSDADGKLVPINRGVMHFPLQQGDNQLQFSAWLQASASAIAERTIEPGNVSAIATFYLNYP
ncbi:fimbrial protein [Pantoea dispersa]|uniref:fimbrial protein n=1 Tax=Pantoea dispersa TaxID=59814 RepID=UPI0021F7918C|nr:fimbrial protein [Pantoea dispersa]UYP73324.1 type 1 fimbrial protein [Pantoea dispersa]